MSLRDDIEVFKVEAFKNVALSIASRSQKFVDLYYSNDNLDRLRGENMLTDLMLHKSDLIKDEIRLMGHY